MPGSTPRILSFVGSYLCLGPGWELYDLKTDRGEAHDLAAVEPAEVRELAALWQQREDEYRILAGPPQPRNPGAKKEKKAGRKKKQSRP